MRAFNNSLPPIMETFVDFTFLMSFLQKLLAKGKRAGDFNQIGDKLIASET